MTVRKQNETLGIMDLSYLLVDFAQSNFTQAPRKALFAV